MNRYEIIEELGCIICGYKYTEKHHIKKKGKVMMGKKPNDNETIGLCADHHRLGDGKNGKIAYHYSPKEFTYRYGSQEYLLLLRR